MMTNGFTFLENGTEYSAPTRVLLTGDRNWAREPDPETGKLVQVENIEHVLLWALLDGLRERGMGTLTEGRAPGADTVGHLWLGENPGVDHMCFPADWEKYGKAAGPIRNQEMLDSGPFDLVVAVNRDWEKSKGTKDMVTRCEKAGLTVFRITSPLKTQDPSQQLSLL